MKRRGLPINNISMVLGFFLLFCNSCTIKENKNTVKDIDGNIYHTITIGNQVWMVENLKTTRYNDGISIPQITDNTEWMNLKSAAFCWYKNDESYKSSSCGALYNWYAVHEGKLTPKGWHVATDSDWKKLEMALGMTQKEADELFWRGTDQGTQLKSIKGWYNSGNGTDLKGFTAIPAGLRDWDDGTFYWIDYYCHWWTSTEESASDAWDRDVHFDHKQIFRYPNNKNYGMSVRCVKDL